MVVAATYDSSSASVLCFTPAEMLGRVAVRLSLNGQQFSPDNAPASLLFYDVDAVASVDPYGQLPPEAEEKAEVVPLSPYQRGLALLQPGRDAMLGPTPDPDGTYASLQIAGDDGMALHGIDFGRTPYVPLGE